MKIISLLLENFKGLPYQQVTLKGNNANIYGDNGTGKTTLYDAFLWLLFNKDSQSNSKFSVKPINTPKGTEVSVTGVFEINGKTVTLKKILKENWTKKRGALEATYSGDVTHCYVNETPYKVKEYAEYIKGICDEEIFKLLTNPMHFNTNIKWQERRKILFEICGNITDTILFDETLEKYGRISAEIKDIISAMQEDNSLDEGLFSDLKAKQENLSILKGYKDLSEAMGEHTFEDFKKILSDRRKSINNEIKLIPTKINEAALSIVKVDVSLANQRLSELKPKKQELETQLNKLQTGSNISALNSELSDLKTKLQCLERANNQHFNEQESTQRKAIDNQAKEIQDNLMKITDELRQTNILYQNTLSQIDTQNQLINRSRNDYISVSKEIKTVDTVCPTCKQAIPKEEIQKAKKAFENNRNAKLTNLKSLGTRAKIKLQELKKQNQELSAKIVSLQSQKKLFKEKFNSIINSIRSKEPTYKNLPNYKTDKAKLQSQMQTKSKEIDNAKVNLTQEIERLKTALKSATEEIEKFTKDVLQDEQNKVTEKRISDYEKQQKEYVKKFEETEKQLYYCDLFTKKKVNLITKQVNSKFKIAKFKLFNHLVNGGLEDCCEVVVNDVPFSDLNNAMRINVGLDIINTLQQHYKFAPPVFVDNAESVTVVYKLNSQMIKLVVSEKDDTLRIESEV